MSGVSWQNIKGKMAKVQISISNYNQEQRIANYQMPTSCCLASDASASNHQHTDMQTARPLTSQVSLGLIVKNVSVNIANNSTFETTQMVYLNCTGVNRQNVTNISKTGHNRHRQLANLAIAWSAVTLASFNLKQQFEQLTNVGRDGL